MQDSPKEYSCPNAYVRKEMERQKYIFVRPYKRIFVYENFVFLSYYITT